MMKVSVCESWLWQEGPRHMRLLEPAGERAPSARASLTFSIPLDHSSLNAEVESCSYSAASGRNGR